MATVAVIVGAVCFFSAGVSEGASSDQPAQVQIGDTRFIKDNTRISDYIPGVTKTRGDVRTRCDTKKKKRWCLFPGLLCKK